MPLANVINSNTTDVAFLWLLTVRDPSSSLVLRAVNNLEDVVSRGNTFTAFPFDLVLPPDDGQRPQNCQLVCANVDQALTRVIRETLAPPQVLLELVLSDALNTVEKAIDFMKVAEVQYDANQVTFTLAPSNLFARKTCTATYNQAEFPALFRAL